MKKLITAIFLLVSVVAFGQNTDQYQKNRLDSLIKNKGYQITPSYNQWLMAINSKVSILAPKLKTTSTIGYVWTATDALGNGNWLAPAGGGGDMVLALAQTSTGKKTFTTGGVNPGINITGFAGVPSGAVDGDLWKNNTAFSFQSNVSGALFNMLMSEPPNSVGGEIVIFQGLGGITGSGEVSIPTTGNIKFGRSTTSGATRTLSADGTLSAVSLVLNPKGIGGVSVGLTTPTAKLHLPAGTATAGTASLKINSGTLLTTTEAGAIENNGTHLYYTATDGGSRLQLDNSGVGLTTASNGLTATGSDVALGGTLVGASTVTTISGPNNNAMILDMSTGTSHGVIQLASIETFINQGVYPSSFHTTRYKATGIDFEYPVNTDYIVFDGTNQRMWLGNPVTMAQQTATLSVGKTDAANSSVTQLLSLLHTSSVAPAVGIGAGIEFKVHTGTSNYEVGVNIEAVTTDVTSTSEDFDLVFKTMTAGAAATPKFRFASTGAFGIGGATYGTAGQFLTSGGPSAPPTWTTLSGAAAAGADTQVQYNNAGAFGASAGLTYVDGLGTLALIKSQNAPTFLNVSNTTSGTAAIPGIRVIGNGGDLYMALTSPTYTPLGMFEANKAVISANNSIGLNLGTGGTGIVKLYTADAARMTILADGKVGIGHATPSALLDVSAAVNTTAIISRTNGVLADGDHVFFLGHYTNTSTNQLQIGVHSTGANNPDYTFINNPQNLPLILQTGTGKVGIGTPAPGALLHLKDATTSTLALIENTSTGQSGIGIIRSGINPSTWTMYIGGSQTRLSFHNVADRVTFLDNGNVGIGTTNPTYQLQIVRAAGAGITTEATTGSSFYRAANTSGAFYFGMDSNSASGFGAGNYTRVIYSSGAYPIAFFTTDVERMRILANGYIGIGTATSLAPLHINSPASVSSLILQQNTAGAGFQQILFSVAGSIDGNSGNGAIIRSTTNRVTNAYSNLEFFTSADVSAPPTSRMTITGLGQYILTGLTGSGTTTVTVTAGGQLGRTSAFTLDGGDNIVFTDAKNIFTGLVTGTQIGGSSLQKLALWGATPVVRPTTSIIGLAKVAVGGSAVNENDTYGGYTIGQIVAALKLIGALN